MWQCKWLSDAVCSSCMHITCSFVCRGRWRGFLKVNAAQHVFQQDVSSALHTMVDICSRL